MISRTLKFRLGLGCASLLLGTLASCGGGGGGSSQQPSARAKWTVLVYMNAANDLQPFAAPNVNDMEVTGSTSDVNIVLEWQQARCAQCGSPDWVGTRRYYISRDADTSTVHSQVVQDLGSSVDTGNWQELQSFLQWGQSHYPADHYAVVLWDHGSGWLNFRGAKAPKPATPRSVSFNYATGSEIRTWELPSALNVSPKMDMVVFDASLLQQMEVDYEIRNSTSFIVGSEESPPGRGYIYNTFLSDLAASPAMTPQQFGSQIVHRTIDDYAQYDNDPVDLASLTQSEIDTSKLQNLADKLNAFANSLIAHRTDAANVEASARSAAKNYGAAEGYADYKDLWDYANRIKNGGVAADLAQAAADVQTALSSAALTEAHSSGENGSHGLTIDVPDPGQFTASYVNLAFAKATQWPAWLQSQTK
jgi:hypothetical protein